MHITYIWLLIAGTTFFAELGHPGLFISLAICIGSISAALVASWFGLPYQLCTFIVITSIAFSLLRSYIKKQKTHHTTNAAALIGKQGIVTEQITATTPGRVRINSEEWRAQGLHDTFLEPGSRITVVRIERTTLIVSPLHNS